MYAGNGVPVLTNPFSEILAVYHVAKKAALSTFYKNSQSCVCGVSDWLGLHKQGLYKI